MSNFRCLDAHTVERTSIYSVCTEDSAVLPEVSVATLVLSKRPEIATTDNKIAL